MRFPRLILASTSPYRRELLARLQLPFEAVAPDVDETALPGETAEQTSLRLAIAKAEAVGKNNPAALTIGSDQVALLNGQQLGKPGNFDNAMRQLQMMRGQQIVFHTALCLHNGATGHNQAKVVPYSVTMRDYSDATIRAYLEKEQPYNCAGSAKTEGLGIALIARMEGTDPNALIGLPLIELIDMLANEGVSIL